MERRLDINLLPPEFRPQPAVRWYPIYLAVLYSLAVVLLLWVGFSSLNRVKALEGRITRAEREIDNLKVFADAYDAAERSVRTFDNLKRLFVYLDQLFFKHLEPNLPRGVWIETVECVSVTTTPKKKKPRLSAAAEDEEGKEKPAEAKAQGYTSAGVPLHTGEITIEGTINGYDLMPLSILLENLQEDPYFLEPYILSSELIEDEEEGVTRTFELVVRVSMEKGVQEESSAAEKGGEAA